MCVHAFNMQVGNSHSSGCLCQRSISSRRPCKEAFLGEMSNSLVSHESWRGEGLTQQLWLRSASSSPSGMAAAGNCTSRLSSPRAYTATIRIVLLACRDYCFGLEWYPQACSIPFFRRSKAVFCGAQSHGEEFNTFFIKTTCLLASCSICTPLCAILAIGVFLCLSHCRNKACM